jgi:hypothetical protein
MTASREHDGAGRVTRFVAQAEDPQVRQADWQDALDRLLADWTGITADQRDELVDQVREAIDDDDLATLAGLSVSTHDADDVLSAVLTELAESAAADLATVAAEHGVTVDPVVDTVMLAYVSAVAASLLASGLALAAGAEALRVLRPGVTADEVADHVEAHLDGLSDAYLVERLGGALTMAQNHGRAAVLAEIPDATFTASEANDVNTCGPCSALDGTEFEDLDAALAVYGMGGNPECLGRWRCRGTIEVEWESVS